MPIAELSNPGSFAIALHGVKKAARNANGFAKSWHVISQHLALARFGSIHHLSQSFVSKLAVCSLVIMPGPGRGKSTVLDRRWPTMTGLGLIG